MALEPGPRRKTLCTSAGWREADDISREAKDWGICQSVRAPSSPHPDKLGYLLCGALPPLPNLHHPLYPIRHLSAPNRRHDRRLPEIDKYLLPFATDHQFHKFNLPGLAACSSTDQTKLKVSRVTAAIETIADC